MRHKYKLESKVNKYIILMRLADRRTRGSATLAWLQPPASQPASPLYPASFCKPLWGPLFLLQHSFTFTYLSGCVDGWAKADTFGAPRAASRFDRPARLAPLHAPCNQWPQLHNWTAKWRAGKRVTLTLTNATTNKIPISSVGLIFESKNVNVNVNACN